MEEYESSNPDPDPDPPFLLRPFLVGARVTMRAPPAGLDTTFADGAALRDATTGLLDGAGVGPASSSV